MGRVADVLEASLESSLEMNFGRDLEYLVVEIWTGIDFEVENFPVLCRLVADHCSLVTNGHIRWGGVVAELNNANVTIVLDELSSLAQDFSECIKVVDESGHAVANDGTVNLLSKLEVVVEDVSTNQIKLIDDSLLGEIVASVLNHLA